MASDLTPSSALGAAITREERSFIDGVAATRAVRRSHRAGGTVSRGCRVDGEELLQQGLHLALHGFGSSYTAPFVHGLEQDTEVSIRVAKMNVAEDARQG